VTPLEIRLVTNNRDEAEARDQLQRLLTTYDLKRWQFTSAVQIEYLTRPHSHPVLTLSTHHLNDDNAALSTYLHEQLHWFSLTRAGDLYAATQELRQRYPSVPSGLEGGAADDRSTYLHLVICSLELQSLEAVIGTDAAAATLKRFRQYGWIYDQVLDNREWFDSLFLRHGIVVP